MNLAKNVFSSFLLSINGTERIWRLGQFLLFPSQRSWDLLLFIYSIEAVSLWPRKPSHALGSVTRRETKQDTCINCLLCHLIL